LLGVYDLLGQAFRRLSAAVFVAVSVGRRRFLGAFFCTERLYKIFIYTVEYI